MLSSLQIKILKSLARPGIERKSHIIYLVLIEGLTLNRSDIHPYTTQYSRLHFTATLVMKLASIFRDPIQYLTKAMLNLQERKHGER